MSPTPVRATHPFPFSLCSPFLFSLGFSLSVFGVFYLLVSVVSGSDMSSRPRSTGDTRPWDPEVPLKSPLRDSEWGLGGGYTSVARGGSGTSPGGPTDP